MLNRDALEGIIARYKEDFTATTWPEEKYKWRAVQHFQDNWDIDADDFPGMLRRALAGTGNLLASQSNYPRKMIVEFAQIDPEAVRGMFRNLFDEGIDLQHRIDVFKESAGRLLQQHGAPSDYQNENAISTYLWLRYPDTHYVYKWSVVREVARQLGSDFRFKQGHGPQNVLDQSVLYGEIHDIVGADEELAQMLHSVLTEDCYPDPNLTTLTGDLGFYIAGNPDVVQERPSDEWWPPLDEYDPGLDTEGWKGLLADPDVFTSQALEIMKRMVDHGGAATCTQLSRTYGELKNFYNSGSQALARRVVSHTGCPVMRGEDRETRWWPVLYQGQRAPSDAVGSYTWRLRDELAAALAETDLGPVQLYAASGPVPGEDPGDSQASVEPYGQEDFLRDVYMDVGTYTQLVGVLRRKKNVILQGAPGVGKTWAATRLAWSMMGEKDSDRVEFVQFHQSYSYEDFVQGYKPSGDGFALQEGIFQRFCRRAAERPGEEFFFIIDEINRGNLSKIFGELLMLIERDYRGTELTLAYGGVRFSVPRNVSIIGMMNTADRSLALVDYALRRRFSFIEMPPGFDSAGFSEYQHTLHSPALDRLVSSLKELNRVIAEDPSLGKGFCIGHSYLCGQDEVTGQWLRAVVDFDVVPMLEEYWFDDQTKVDTWRSRLRDAIRS